MRPLVMAFALAASAVACTGSGGSQTGPESPGTMAPDFTARDVDGKTVRLSDYLGHKVVLLDFWSTFCEPCKAELPHLSALAAKEKARGLVVLGVSMDGPETVAEVPAFVKRYSVSFPVLLDEDSRISSLYNPKKAAPFAVLIDKTGRIVKVREGYNPNDEELIAADVKNALDHAEAVK